MSFGCRASVLGSRVAKVGGKLTAGGRRKKKVVVVVCNHDDIVHSSSSIDIEIVLLL